MRTPARTLIVLALAATAILAAISGANAASGNHRYSQFQSPSHNIGCVLLGGAARCDIRHRTYQLPARPKACPREVNFGQGVEVGKSGIGAIVCAGDTALNPADHVLAYNASDHFGNFVCFSKTAGVTCNNVTNGHGFFISIQSYRVF